MKFLTFLFLWLTSILYAGDSFLENVTTINWMTFFSFVLLIFLVILQTSFNTTKAIKITFLTFCLLYLSGMVENWHKKYTPIIGYDKQKPATYGVYEEVYQIVYFKDKNITNIFYGQDYHFFLVSTEMEAYLFSYDSSWAIEPNMRHNIFRWQDNIKIKNLSTYKIAYDGNLILCKGDRAVQIYTPVRDNQKGRFLFTRMKDNEKYLDFKKINQYPPSYKRELFGQNAKLFIEDYDCNDTGYAGIILDRKNKSFYLCYQGIRYKTTHTKDTPKLGIYISDTDTVLMAFEEKKGLYVLRNKYAKTYHQIQDSVTQLLEKINQPKWNKVDLKKINLDRNKIQKLIDIFTPYEKNQYHSVRYKVILYNKNKATVKAMVDEQHTIFFYLRLINDSWHIEDIQIEKPEINFKNNDEEA